MLKISIQSHCTSEHLILLSSESMMLCLKDFQFLNGLNQINEKDTILISIQDQSGTKQLWKQSMNKLPCRHITRDLDQISSILQDGKIALEGTDLDTFTMKFQSQTSTDTKVHLKLKTKKLFGHSKTQIKSSTQEASLELTQTLLREKRKWKKPLILGIKQFQKCLKRD